MPKNASGCDFSSLREPGSLADLVCYRCPVGRGIFSPHGGDVCKSFRTLPYEFTYATKKKWNHSVDLRGSPPRHPPSPKSFFFEALGMSEKLPSSSPKAQVHSATTAKLPLPRTRPKHSGCHWPIPSSAGAETKLPAGDPRKLSSFLLQTYPLA